jgi:hypothetical protein
MVKRKRIKRDRERKRWSEMEKGRERMKREIERD